MRTLWLTNDLPPRAGGIQQFVHNLLVRSWPDEALAIAPEWDGSGDHDRRQPYRIERVRGPVVPSPRIRRRVREAAGEHRPDVLVLGATWPLGELAPAFGHETGVPVVALTHGLEAGFAKVGLGVLIRRATRGLAAATAISTFAEELLAPHVRADRLVRLPPGVDVTAFRPDVDGTALRARWGVPAGAPLVGCISRLVKRKGQDRLLAAWPEVRRRHPEAWLAVVGTGPLEAALRKRAAQLPGVVLAGGVAWEELPAAHAALDVFAMPCRTRMLGTDVEGLGIVYLEAQACGIPVVAGRSGGAPEAVREGETGFVVDGEDPRAIAVAIGSLLGDAVRREAMGRAGREWVERVWSWEHIAARFRDLLGEVDAEAAR